MINQKFLKNQILFILHNLCFMVTILQQQMISKEKIFRSFSVHNNQYLIENCKWKLINQEGKINMPGKRFSHSSTIMDGYLYLFGGTNIPEQDDNNLYIMNLKNMQWIINFSPNGPKSRDSHGCTTYQNSIYIYGGSTVQEQYNDMYLFNPLQDKWIPVIAQGENRPTPRDLPIFQSINDQFLFLYGGMNLKQQQIYDDAYIFKSNKWYQLKIYNPPSKRIGVGIAVCGRRVFMFGGNAGQNDTLAFYDDLYEIQIYQLDLAAKFKKIETKSLRNPKPRAYHGMQKLSNNYFIVIGGETYPHKTQGKFTIEKQAKTLNDIWVFSIFESIWIQIQPKNGPLKSLQNFSISVQENNLYIFGGLRGLNTVVGDIIMLSFAQQSISKYSICSNCIDIKNQELQRKKNEPLKPAISIGFLYNMSLMIKFSFQAIALIIDFIKELSATKTRIMLEKARGQFTFISFHFDGQMLNDEDLAQIIMHTGKKQRNRRMANYLKLGGFKLGKTILLISSDQNTRKVLMLSADSKITPLFEDSNIFYTYKEDIVSGQTYGSQGINHKKYIVNALQSYLQDASILNVKNQNKIYIFQPNVIMTAEKVYYYQLISYVQSDIRIYRNTKKLQFLNEDLDIDVYNSPQLSLSSYLRVLRLNQTMEIFINDTQQPILVETYEQTLKRLKQQGKIVPISCEKVTIKGISYTLELFLSPLKQYLSENYGILIYYKDRLINRFECEFGNMFNQKLYNPRIKKSSLNFWPTLGYLNIESCEDIQLNFTKTKIEDIGKYSQLISHIYQIIQKNQEIKFMGTIPEDNQQQKKQNKKIKKNES